MCSVTHECIIERHCSGSFLGKKFFEDVITCSKQCVKSACIRSFSGPYFPASGLITERYSVSLRIQTKYKKLRTIKTPNTDIFHAVNNICERLPCFLTKAVEISWKRLAIFVKSSILDIWLGSKYAWVYVMNFQNCLF